MAVMAGSSDQAVGLEKPPAPAFAPVYEKIHVIFVSGDGTGLTSAGAEVIIRATPAEETTGISRPGRNGQDCVILCLFRKGGAPAG